MSSKSRNQKLSKKDLEKRITQFLKEQNMCVLATCSDDIPRATPIEYHSKGMTIYFVGEPGTKIRNITSNPNVSIGIFLPYTNWDSVKGAQVTGNAKIISKMNTVEFKEGLEAYQWEKTAEKLGIKKFPETIELIKVESTRIEFIDVSLKKMGYSSRQTLEP
jgi:nitroimidazol reductase NimA-like FMN-containing flavoprotein (pyridoxamine 5'-phosphate oxidase superfamily)